MHNIAVVGACQSKVSNTRRLIMTVQAKAGKQVKARFIAFFLIWHVTELIKEVARVN
jgi:hypothetical protein